MAFCLRCAVETARAMQIVKHEVDEVAGKLG